MESHYFDSAPVARRYARARPYLHPWILGLAAPRIGRVDRALDVGAGTGMSSVALCDRARLIVALDRSFEMLAEAPLAPAIARVVGEAERLPLASAAVDLVSLGLAYHWLDHTRFLPEARRVLRPEGWLLVYNTFCAGRLRGTDALTRWWGEHYLTRYPPPPERRQHIDGAQAQAHGFRLVDHLTGEQDVIWTTAEFVDYLTTHSNVLASVEAGEPLGAVVGWLSRALGGIIPGGRGTFVFRGEVWLLR
jgi:SAM-dependent methyltransferase